MAAETPDRPQPCRISVLIPAYMRPDDLVTTIRKTRDQTFSGFEMVVVDDGTPSTAIADAVAACPGVVYVRSDRNCGLIAARNLGARYCRGDYVLNLDDDSWLIDADGLARLVHFLDTNPDVAIAALNIDQAGAGLYWRPTRSPFALAHYIGCGYAYRRTMIERVGPYIEEFVRQGEELDRAMRVIDEGGTVMALPGIGVYHSCSPINRNTRRNAAFEAANLLRRELIRAPLAALPFALMRFLRHVVGDRRTIDFAVLREELLGDRVPLLRFVRARRQPVRFSTYLKCIRLRRQSHLAAA